MSLKEKLPVVNVCDMSSSSFDLFPNCLIDEPVVDVND